MARWPSRAMSCSVLAVLASGAALAQNGSNYDVLSNGGDTMLLGVGAGGSQTASDGLLTFIPGEDLRGPTKTPLGEFGYRLRGWVDSECIPHANPHAIGPLAIRFPTIAFVELDGLNGNAPPVFTNPACSQPSFPLGSSGFVPYGTGPGSTASFVLVNLPSSGILPAGAQALLPNNGLSPAGMGGVATPIAVASASLQIASTGFCWSVQFTWNPSALVSLDNIDGWAHYLANSPDANQYWMLSDNEENLWQSETVGTTAGGTGLMVFPANVDFDLVFVSIDPVTKATVAPRAGGTVYSSWTRNVSNEYGVVSSPNGGFDVGRGSETVSFSGKAGVANPNTGVGNQDPSQGPGVVPTLGFATWDSGGDHDGSVRLTWVSFDILGARGGNPDLDPGVLVQGGAVRLPVVSAGLPQPVTDFGFKAFGHVTQFGFVGPFNNGFNVVVGGASNQLPLGPHPGPCLGLALNVTYGTVGRLGKLGTPGRMTFNQNVAATSGSKQLFLFD